MAWQNDASCFQHVTIEKKLDLWNTSLSGFGNTTTADAKTICWACPVRDECLQDALDKKEGYGVRGGFTPRERRELIRAINE